MPIRFPTEAANDPGIGDARSPVKGHASGSPARHSRTGADSRSSALADEARPGKGINQAGFLHERDKGDSPGTE